MLLGCTALAQLPGWEAGLPPYEQANLALNRQWVEQLRARGEPPARVGVYADASVWHLGLVNVVACLAQAHLFPAGRHPCSAPPRRRDRPPWPSGLPEWDTFSPQQRKLFIKQADAYLAYTDH